MKSKYVTLLGVPSDLGANKDGSARAPKVIRTHLIRAFKKANIKFEDLGDVVAPKALHLVEGKKRHYPAIKALSRAFEIKRKCDIARCFPILCP